MAHILFKYRYGNSLKKSSMLNVFTKCLNIRDRRCNCTSVIIMRSHALLRDKTFKPGN